MIRQSAGDSSSLQPDADDYRFPRHRRLLAAADYSTVFRKSRVYSDRFWTVRVHRHSGCQSRLGLAIAKKRAKKSVQRNRLKRIARECFRHRYHDCRGCWLVVMNRDAAAEADRELLRQSLDHLIDKISQQ